MYIENLKLWNFRKYGSSTDVTEETIPHLEIPFNKGLNVLIGENDSGKSAILDAIKLVLKTHAYEWIKVGNDDFHKDTNKLRIEIIFRGLEIKEARHFTEWIGWDKEEDGQTDKPLLRIIYQVERNSQRIFPAEVCAGMDFTGMPINAVAREYLKTTYLKALRDADTELTAKRNSRVAQIFQNHDLLKRNVDEQHYFERVIELSNKAVNQWFDNDNNNPQIKGIINEFVKAFINDDIDAIFNLSEPEILSILEKIAIGIAGNSNPGLGTLNRLYMAVELLHLRKANWDGARVCLIEELEAHLHPQAQLKVIEKLQTEEGVQFIMTTHSPNLASKVPLESLIICKNNDAFPMGNKYTQLDKDNYKYLEHFLDVTKSNLFFAKGVIIVEGWSEQILIPTLAKRLGYDLTKKEVSIINVGSTAYLHFAKIFLRNDDVKMGIPVAIIADLDLREYEREPKIDENGNIKKNGKKTVYEYIKQPSISYCRERAAKRKSIIDGDRYVKAFVSNIWTLEYCLLKSDLLSKIFKNTLKSVHSDVFNDACTTEEEWEKGLARIMLSKSIKKTEIANQMVTLVERTNLKDHTEGEAISYLIKAIEHACSEKPQKTDDNK